MKTYIMRCSGAAALHAIDVLLYDPTDTAAAKSAVTRAKKLHAAGYYRYDVFSGFWQGDEFMQEACIARFSTGSNDPHITTTEWPRG